MDSTPHHILVPIVGLRHFVKDVAATLAEMLPGREVMLIPDRGNRRDKTAIQAWADGRQIGFVSSDFTEIIHVNYPDLCGLRVEVAENELAIEDSVFYVEVEISTLELPAYATAIACDGLHGVALPGLLPARRVALMEIDMRCSEIESYFDGESVDEGVVETLIDIARRFAAIYGHSLSGSERRLYIRIMLLMNAAMTYWTQNCFDLYEEILGLSDIRREFARDAETAAAVMEAEIEAVRAEMADFIGEIEALIHSGLATREELREENEQWLRALPDHLYAHLGNATELAARLLYLRLDTSELHAIYAHMILREWVSRTRKTRKAEPSIKDDFAYWATTDAAKRANAVEAMRNAVLQNHRYGKALAEVIADLIYQKIIRSANDKRAFIRSLNALLDLPDRELKYSTLIPYLP